MCLECPALDDERIRIRQVLTATISCVDYLTTERRPAVSPGNGIARWLRDSLGVAISPVVLGGAVPEAKSTWLLLLSNEGVLLPLTPQRRDSLSLFLGEHRERPPGATWMLAVA